MTNDSASQRQDRPGTMNLSVPRPSVLLRKFTQRTAAGVFFIVIAILLAAIWYENWSANNQVQDVNCAYLEYDFDGVRNDSLNAQQQELDEIYGCNLDLPLSNEDE